MRTLQACLGCGKDTITDEPHKPCLCYDCQQRLKLQKTAITEQAATHTPGPWAWQLFGDTYTLTAQHGRREQIIAAIPHGEMKYPVVAMNKDGRLCDVDPQHPNALLIASAPDMAKEIAQLKQQNEELKAHEQEIRDCWTEERTDHNKAREEIAQLRADKDQLVGFLKDMLNNGNIDKGTCWVVDKSDIELARELIKKHDTIS